ncbi:MAG: hypothetical protein NC192_09840 [Muribaculaceae bacterium]|nr:hypothetical protein [Muribaculaceae bacterium]
MKLNETELTEMMKPDTYLLYETRPNAPTNTNIRFALEITEDINGEALYEAVNAAAERYPYFSVRVKNENGSYAFAPNSLPIAVMKTKIPAPPLGSEEVNYHLNYVDYADDTIYFNVSHSITDASGYIPFIKSVLCMYLVGTHGEPISSEGINLPGSEFLRGELDFPKIGSMPESDFSLYKEPEMGFFPADDYIRAMKEPDPKGSGYYCISMKQRELMKYVHSNDASPAAIIAVFMFKALAPLFPNEELFSAGIACNFREAVGCPNAYHSISRALHVCYRRSYLDMPADKLGTITRGMIMLQSQPENSVIQMKKTLEFYEKVDSLENTEDKRNFCLNEGLFTKGCKDTYNVSYVGQTDFGAMNGFVRSLNTMAYGNLLVEINAIGNMFYITLNQVTNTDRYINAFLNVLNEAELSYSVSNYRMKNIAALELP